MSSKTVLENLRREVMDLQAKTRSMRQSVDRMRRSTEQLRVNFPK